MQELCTNTGLKESKTTTIFKGLAGILVFPGENGQNLTTHWLKKKKAFSGLVAAVYSHCGLKSSFIIIVLFLCRSKRHPPRCFPTVLFNCAVILYVLSYHVYKLKTSTYCFKSIKCSSHKLREDFIIKQILKALTLCLHHRL